MEGERDRHPDYQIVYVAVSRKINDSLLAVEWAMHNSEGREIRILHVCKPSKITPGSTERLEDVIARHEDEREEMLQAVERLVKPQYAEHGEKVPILLLEAEFIGYGILQLIEEEKIGILVMGAAADSRYWEGMSQLESRKARHVMRKAPDFCQMWFVCNGNLILTRYPEEPAITSQERSRNKATQSSNTSRSQSARRFSEEMGSDSPSPSQLNRAHSNSPLPDGGSTPRRRSSNNVGSDSPGPSRAHSSSRGKSLGNDLYVEIDKLKAEIDHFRGKAESELKKRREAEKKNEEYNEQQEQFKKELHNVKTQNVKYKKQRDNLRKEVHNFKTQNEEYKKQRDDMEINLRNALGFLETRFVQELEDFTYSEILEATDDLSPLRMIGEGGFGITYKGPLRGTEMAIKVLAHDSMQGPREFKQEADTLSKLRHPNIVTLIGICSEASALIYEYYPKGSLEDRLFCRDDTPPLTWKIRICIAVELCSALTFMHSCQPESIIHRDLKPANILLDDRLSCKLSDFGICRAVDINMTSTYRTDPQGTFSYMDPEFMSTRKLTPKSDVYSFGIILLQLLTRKPPLGLIQEVRTALDNNNLIAVLDPSAGDWPYEQAKQLADLGLWCCEMQRRNRPDLEADVMTVLGPMKFSVGSSNESEEAEPSYFTCPITQEVMQDPQIAADGFTYEGEYLRGWLASGHDTSPMTNLRLENQTLIPNRALRSAIQEWLQRR